MDRGKSLGGDLGGEMDRGKSLGGDLGGGKSLGN